MNHLAVVLLAFVLAGCAIDMERDEEAAPTGGKLDDPSARCEGDAHYVLVLDNLWREPELADEHVARIAGGVHRALGATEDPPWAWRPGKLASALEALAEVSDTSGLLAQMAADTIQPGSDPRVLATYNGDNAFVFGPEGFGPDGAFAGTCYAFPDTLELTPHYSQVTLAAMIAPTPDWFVGVSGLSLCQDGEWVDRIRVPLTIFDAGTERHPGLPRLDLAGIPIPLAQQDGVQAVEDAFENEADDPASPVGALLPQFADEASVVNVTFERVSIEEPRVDPRQYWTRPENGGYSVQTSRFLEGILADGAQGCPGRPVE